MTDRRRRACLVGLAGLTIGVAVLLYRGPGWHFTRGHVGDVGAAMIVYAAFAFVLPRWGVRACLVACLAVCFAIELGQTVWSQLGRTGAGAIFLGSVFDPIDLAAYVVGAIIGALALRTDQRAA